MIIKDFKLYTDDEDAEKYQDCYALKADFDKKEVMTNCGDFYYDYSISFDDFIKFAKYIEKDTVTILGYDKEDIEFAKRLMQEGITPHELKEHYHDFAWVAKIIREDTEKMLDQSMKNAISKFDNLGKTKGK